MKKPLVLIVDDEPHLLELLEMTLSPMDIDTCRAEDVRTAKQLLQNKAFDLCLTDMRLPDGDGLELVDFIQTLPTHLPVAVISAHGNMDTAVLAMKKGAFDFISKPIDLPIFRQIVRNALKLNEKLNENESEKLTASQSKKTASTTGERILLGDSIAISKIREKIDKLARSQAPVYISGESGSGKELVARLIHQQSSRHNEPFIAINCGAIPMELMESEFFGHKKGSFTGAGCDKIGLFQAAEGGTLFLDEIADLPISLQVKLLRAIQEKRIRPVGDTREIQIDIRLLSATHKNLADMVQEGSFRQDLYYRINVIDLYVPPLRERVSDIPQLTDFILTKLLDVNQVKPKLSNEALSALQNYHFPGNVRELENILERALTLHEDNIINICDLNLPDSDDYANLPSATDYNPADGTLEEYLEKIERKAIIFALEKNKWNKTATAKKLGLTFRSFRHRLKKLNLDET